MLGNHPFRHLGPRVFISYSYLDRTLADRLQVILTAKGFQVRKEDETRARLSTPDEHSQHHGY